MFPPNLKEGPVISEEIDRIVNTEIEREYARLVAILASFEDRGMPESDQLAYFKGVLGAQYAYLAGLLTDEDHSDLMYQIYELAGFHADHKFAHLFN